MLIEIHIFSFKKIHLKMSSGKWRPFCLGLNVLRLNGGQQPSINSVEPEDAKKNIPNLAVCGTQHSIWYTLDRYDMQ